MIGDDPHRMPDVSFNVQKPSATKPTWNATPLQLQAKQNDERDIQQMVEYRSKFMPDWDKAIRAWNLLAEPINDPNVSNVLFPLARMLATASLTAMSKGRPGFKPKPGGPSDFKKVDLLWNPAIDAVLSECNFDNQQDFFLTDWEITGTGIYEVYTETPTRTLRVLKKDSPEDKPEYDEKITRDFTRPRLGVRYRTPYECGISPFARTADEAPSCYWQESMSREQFVQNYARVKLTDGKYKYMNTEHVEPGKIAAVGIDGTLEFRESEYKGVIVVRYQNKIQDVDRQWANGVLIYDKPLKKDRFTNLGGANALGETSLCWGTNWHQHDKNNRTHSLYGMGDPHLIKGLDAIYQAFSNMTIDNWVRANSNVLSFKSFNGMPGANQQLTMKDMYSNLQLLNGGEVISSPLGQVSLANYGWMKDFLENTAIYLGRSNFKQLVGDTSSTAYELFQKVQANNEGFLYRLKKLENGCYKKLGRLVLSGVMSELTVADYEDLTEEQVEEVVQLIKDNKTSGDDYENLLSEDVVNNPPRRKVRFMIPTHGRVYKETVNKDGKYDMDSLQEVDCYRGKQDGFIAARPEWVWSQEYAERGGVPDVYVESKSQLGDNQNVEMAKAKLIAEYARARIMEGMQSPGLETDFNMKEIDEWLVEKIDAPKDRVFKKADPTSMENDEVDGILSQITDFLKPVNLSAQTDVAADPRAQGPAQPPGAPSPAPTPDLEQFTPFGRGSSRPQASVGAAAAGTA